MKNGCPVCRNVNELTATACRFCGAALTPPQPIAPKAPAKRANWPLRLGGLAALLFVVVLGVVAFSGGDTGAPTTAFTREIGTDEGAALKFDPQELEVPANQPVKITFHNKATLPHNLAFEGAITDKTEQQVAPGTTQDLEFTTPAVGEYKYVCTLHPGMEGKLKVVEKVTEAK